MKAVILIGGLGTRLRPFTLHTPKPLLPLLGKPFLSYLIDKCRIFGIQDIILCTAYKPETFRSVFGSGERLGVRLHYVHETSPLGTGGAIKNAEALIDDETLILNGDILMDVDFKELFTFHRQKKAAVTLTLTPVEDPTSYGLIELKADGSIQRFLEKPKPEEVTCNTINAGAYIFNKSVFQEIPANVIVSIERDTFPKLLQKGFSCFGMLFNGYWLDMGTAAKYAQAHSDLLLGKYKWIEPEKIVSDMVNRYEK